MKETINLSIIIPTYKRPDLLHDCLQSIINQNVIPREIIIGNDDTNSQVTELSLKTKFNLPIYLINRNHSLGQAKNVQDLFNRVSSDWLMLLHDDDMLIEYSLSQFFNCIDKSSLNTINFGMQKILKGSSIQSDEEALEFNKSFNRDLSVSKLSNFEIVCKHTVPSNGYILYTKKAKEIGYIYNIGFSNYGLVKDACDYAFTWNCFKYDLKFNFVPLFTSIYRISDVSVSSTKNVTILESFLVEFDILNSLKLNKDQENIIKYKLNRRFIKSLKTSLRIKNYLLFRNIFISKINHNF